MPFKKHNTFGKGRPVGSGNKIAETIKEKFAYLPEQLKTDIEMIEDPLDRAKLSLEVLKLIVPRPAMDVNVQPYNNVYEHMTDEELDDEAMRISREICGCGGKKE